MRERERARERESERARERESAREREYCPGGDTPFTARSVDPGDRAFSERATVDKSTRPVRKAKARRAICRSMASASSEVVSKEIRQSQKSETQMKKTYNVIHDTLSPKNKMYSQAKARQIVCHSMASASFEVFGRVKET